MEITELSIIVQLNWYVLDWSGIKALEYTYMIDYNSQPQLPVWLSRLKHN